MSIYRQKFYSFLLLSFNFCFFSFLLSTFFYFISPLYTKAEYWIPELIEIKDNHAQSIEPGKIIISSGSNALFGISSPVLEEKLHAKVLNLALHAAMPLDFFSFLIKKYAQKGDIVIMPLEYEYYSRDEMPTGWEVTQFSTWGKNYLSLFSSHKQFEIFRRALLTYPARYPYVFKKIPVRGIDQIQVINPQAILSKHAYITEYSNSYCEFCIDLDSSVADNKSFIYVDGEVLVTEFFKKTMVDLNIYLEKIGATLFVTYPVSIKCDSFDMNLPRDYNSVMTFFAILNELNIKTFGNPYLYNLDKRFFWDSQYHMNAKGSILRTLFLADDFSKYMSGLSSPDKPDASYIKDKQAEASVILAGYRKLGYAEDKR